MADLERVVHDDGTGRKRSQIISSFTAQHSTRPLCREPRHRIEIFRRIDAGGHLIVVAANDRRWVDLTNALDDGVGIGAVANQITKYQDSVTPMLRGCLKHGIERLEIAVDVAEDQIAAHSSLSTSRSSSSSGLARDASSLT